MTICEQRATDNIAILIPGTVIPVTTRRDRQPDTFPPRTSAIQVIDHNTVRVRTRLVGIRKPIYEATLEGEEITQAGIKTARERNEQSHSIFWRDSIRP